MFWWEDFQIDHLKQPLEIILCLVCLSVCSLDDKHGSQTHVLSGLQGIFPQTVWNNTNYDITQYSWTGLGNLKQKDHF